MSDALILLSLVLGPLSLGFGIGALVVRRRGRAHQLRALPTSELHRLEVEAGIRKPDPRTYVTRENDKYWRDERGRPRELGEWDPYDLDQREAEASARRRRFGPDRIEARRSQVDVDNCEGFGR